MSSYEVGFRHRLGLAAWFGTLAIALTPSCSFGWTVFLVCHFSEVAWSLQRDASRVNRERWHFSRSYGWGYGKSNLRQPRTLVRWEGQSLQLECDLPRYFQRRKDEVVWSRQNTPMHVDKLPQKIHIDGPDLRIDVLAVKHTAVYRCDLELNSHRAQRRTFYIEFRLTVFEKPPSREKPNLMSVHPREQLVGETDTSQPFHCDVSRREPSVIQWVKLTDTNLLPAPSADDPTLYVVNYTDQLEIKYEWRIHTTSWNFPRKTLTDKIVSRDLEFSQVKARDEGLYACVVSHPDIVQFRIVNLSVVGEHSAVDLMWPSAQDGDLYENSGYDTLDTPEVSPVPAIPAPSAICGLRSNTGFSLTSSTITQTSFFSVMTIVIILATFCVLCITFAAVKIIRNERVYPGQKMTVRPKKKPATQLSKGNSLTNMVYIHSRREEHSMGKKRTRNRLDRFLGLISLPVCQSGPNKMKPYRSERFLSDVEMDPLFFTKRNGLLPVEGVEAGASGSQINPDMKTDFNSANDTDTYVLELANVLAGRESLVQVHRARSIPHISRAASVKSLNCTLLHDITQNRLHQRWTYSDSELCFEIRSKISGDHPFISYSSSRRHSKCDVNYANEPVICSNEAGECHSNGDNTADAISNSSWDGSIRYGDIQGRASPNLGLSR